jgi:molecular chaperone GrpE
MLRALEHAPADVENNPWFSGVKQVQRKFELVLEGQGVAAIEALGQEFDPNFHEAVMFEDASEGTESNIVVQELQRGYKIGDRVLRPTMVKVSK